MPEGSITDYAVVSAVSLALLVVTGLTGVRSGVQFIFQSKRTGSRPPAQRDSQPGFSRWIQRTSRFSVGLGQTCNVGQHCVCRRCFPVTILCSLASCCFTPSRTRLCR